MATAIVDGHYMLHRVSHIPSVRALSTKDGKPSGGVFSFVRVLRGLLYELKEVHRIVVVFDGGHSARRKELFPGYKQRKPMDDKDPDGLTYREKFNLQLNYLKYLLPRLGTKVITVPGREGDDVVGVLARDLVDDLKIVVSDDRDMLQLVSGTVHVFRPMAEERIHVSNYEKLVGYPQDQWLLRKAILGDVSDTIPGVKGVGAKTVDKLIKELGGSIGEYPYYDLFARAIEHPSTKISSIGKSYDTVLRNMRLLDISLEEFSSEEVSSILDSCSALASFDVLAVKKMFIALEFFSLVEDFPGWVTPFQLLR